MKKRILITIDLELHRQVRVAAIQLGVSVSQLYEEGARLRLDQQSARGKASSTGRGAIK